MNIDDITVQEGSEEDMRLIDEELSNAIEHGLEVEIIYWGLIAMKNNPTLTPGQAFILGITEWIK